MADIFIIKLRLKFTIKLVAFFLVLSALSMWNFHSQIEIESDKNLFYLTMTTTGTLLIGWLGLLVFYRLVPWIMDPARSLNEGRLPWWVVNVLLLLGVIGVGGYFVMQNLDGLRDEFELVRSNSVELLEERIQRNAKVLKREESESGLSLLQVAYQEDHPKMVRLLLDYDASIEEMDAEGRNPIIASLENLPLLDALLEGGMDPDEVGLDGIPPLHCAVILQSPEAIDLLLKGGANIDIRDQDYRTPMMRAAVARTLSLVELLIDRGSQLDAFNQRGDTTLHMAVRRGNLELAQLLLKQGADPRIFNFTDMTPLHMAALTGQNQLVRIFLEMPNMTGLMNKEDQSPFDLALQYRKYITCELLLEGGADLNRMLVDGRTKLHQAIATRNYSMARFLIRAGADANLDDKEGHSALDLIRSKELHDLEDLIADRDRLATPIEPGKTGVEE